jgi:hypothetical protein
MIALVKFLALLAQFAHHVRILDKVYHQLGISVGTFFTVCLSVIAVLIVVAVVMARAEKRASMSLNQAA